MKVPVAGYFTDEDNRYFIAASGDQWREIYEGKKVENTGAEDTAGNDAGYVYITATLKDPSKTKELIKELISGAVSADKYTIAADDYSYKFAISRIEGISSFVRVIMYAAVIFGITVVLLFVYYSVRRRSDEIYILKTLGRSKIRVALTVTAEIFFVLLFATLLSCVLSPAVGEALCLTVNERAAYNAAGAVSELSFIAELMIDAEETKAQLQAAADAYSKMGITILYQEDGSIYKWLFAMLAAATAFALFCTAGVASKGLMKKS